MKFEWARRVNNGEPYYECSSKGDQRFSALYAKLLDGRTIEEAYQLDVKGYRSLGDNWKLGKGKDPLPNANIPETDKNGSIEIYDRLYEAYFKLWEQWAGENPGLIDELENAAIGKTITDMFATSPISQARALAGILNERVELRTQPKIKI